MARTLLLRNFALQLALSLILNSALAPSTFAKETPGQFRASCRIEIDNAHLSKSIKRREGVDAVKVNARSICDVYQTNVSLTVQIYQEGLFRDYLRSSYTTNPTRATSNGFRVENKNSKWYCQTKKPSRFYGIAFSTATIGGQQFIAPRARSVTSVSLPCGIWVRLEPCQMITHIALNRKRMTTPLTSYVVTCWSGTHHDTKRKLLNYWQKDI